MKKNLILFAFILFAMFFVFVGIEAANKNSYTVTTSAYKGVLFKMVGHGDLLPVIYRSEDNGQTWVALGDNSEQAESFNSQSGSGGENSGQSGNSGSQSEQSEQNSGQSGNSGSQSEQGSTTGSTGTVELSGMPVASKDITEGKDAVITAQFPTDATGEVVVTINGEEYYGDIINGKAKIIIPDLSAGSYSATVTYQGDDKYIPYESTTNFKVTSSALPPS